MLHRSLQIRWIRQKRNEHTLVMSKFYEDKSPQAT